MEDETERISFTHPGFWALLYLFGLYPAFLIGSLWLPCLAWSVACAFAAEQYICESPTRHLAGALLAFLGSVAILFCVGNEARLATVFLILPSLLFVRWRPRLMGRRLLTRCLLPFGLLGGYVLLVAALYLPAQRLLPLPAVNDDFLFTLRSSGVPDPLVALERDAAIGVVRARLLGQEVDRASLPQRLQEERSERAWVTLFRPVKTSRQARGMAGPGTMVDQLITATDAALATAPRREEWQASRSSIRIQVDLGGPEKSIVHSLDRRVLGRLLRAVLPGPLVWDPVVYDAEPGVDGFLLEGPERTGVVLPGDPIIAGWKGITPRSRKKRYRLHNWEVLWKHLTRRAGIRESPPWAEGGARDFIGFRTYSFAQPVPGEARTVELHRQNVLLPDLDEALLLDRIEEAGDWLLSTVEADGRFDYEYFPTRDRHGRGYNEVRHAGSVYGLFHMYHLALSEALLQEKAPGYLRAGLLALDRVYSKLGPPPGTSAEEGYITFLQGKNGVKSNSGSPSLTLLSFLERPRPEQVHDDQLRAQVWKEGDEEIMRGLARTLVAMIDEEDRVYRLWTEARSGKPVEKEPLYYPGEAMLALARYYQRTGERQWLLAAERIGRRQIAEARKLWVVPDHWVMQALDVLDAVAAEVEPYNDEWQRGAYAMARRYTSEQFPPLSPPFPDYRGAYRRIQEVPRTTRAAARGEAVGAVARIAWRHGDPSERWERSLLEGARHLAEQMWVEDNSFFLPEPQEARGAIRMGIIDMHCRIDNNQHGIVALGNALQAMRRPKMSEAGSR
ncbi:MAG: hypothetical protein VX498_03585 [Myxococcota bacterium]|nr:hypothetical protein [Myxococcota bacterium]